MKRARTSKKAKKLPVAVAERINRRVLVNDADGLRLMSRDARWRTKRGNWPAVAAVEWLEKHAEGFERLALIIEAADYMNARRDIDPDAANHVAVSLTMMRDELCGLRKRLSP